MEEKSIFLNLKGKYNYISKNKKYSFDVLNGNKISCKSLKYLVDPVYDSTFKLLFGINGAEERLIGLLNSILFPGQNEDKIRRLGYLTNEFHSFNQKGNKKSLRADIVCEIERNNNNKFVVAIEMEIGDKGSLTQRLFDYGTSLRNVNSSKNCFSLGISISSRVNSNYVKLMKTTMNNTSTLDYINTVQVNIDNELIKVNGDEDIKINNKFLENEGKEFIKLLGLRNWAEKSGDKFVLPNLKLSDNEAINDCIEYLSSINDNLFVEILIDEKYKLDFANNKKRKAFMKV